jgi:muramoyltetrapeptide carboxypeptidase
LGYIPQVDVPSVLAREGFFAGSAVCRSRALLAALSDPTVRAIVGSRGGYGSTYLLEELAGITSPPKVFLGFSDCTVLQIFLWQKFRWVTFYGPMVAAGFDGGADAAGGYDRESLSRALVETERPWAIDLKAESIADGVAEGHLLGGCLTLVESTLGTPWELQTEGAILMLEDRGMKPYQVDRALMHLKQAGKFRGVKGLILGDFPECDPAAGIANVKEIAVRLLAPLGVPVAWGAPVGHTKRPALTLPLGIYARLSSGEATRLEILEPACVR